MSVYRALECDEPVGPDAGPSSATVKDGVLSRLVSVVGVDEVGNAGNAAVEHGLGLDRKICRPAMVETAGQTANRVEDICCCRERVIEVATAGEKVPAVRAGGRNEVGGNQPRPGLQEPIEVEGANFVRGELMAQPRRDGGVDVGEGPLVKEQDAGHEATDIPRIGWSSRPPVRTPPGQSPTGSRAS